MLTRLSLSVFNLPVFNFLETNCQTASLTALATFPIMHGRLQGSLPRCVPALYLSLQPVNKRSLCSAASGLCATFDLLLG